MGNNEQTAIRLLKDLVSLQNGAPLERDKEEYDKLMNEIYSFLNDIADREIIESVFNSHSPTEPVCAKMAHTKFDTLQEGDWFQGTEEQYRNVLKLEGHDCFKRNGNNWVKAMVIDNHCVFSDSGLYWQSPELKKTQLTPEEFLRRADNTFKTK